MSSAEASAVARSNRHTEEKMVEPEKEEEADDGVHESFQGDGNGGTKNRPGVVNDLGVGVREEDERLLPRGGICDQRLIGLKRL